MRLERKLRSLFTALAILALSTFAFAQQRERTPAPAAPPSSEEKPADKDKKPEEKPAKEEKPSVTHHEIRIGGTAIRYTATAGYMPMKDETGKLKANIFY